MTTDEPREEATPKPPPHVTESNDPDPVGRFLEFVYKWMAKQNEQPGAQPSAMEVSYTTLTTPT